MNVVIEQNSIITESLRRLLERCPNARGLCAEDLSVRVAATVQKYLLRDNAEVSVEQINEFVGEINLLDLCLVTACERGDEAAWRDLMTMHKSTVLSAARTATSGKTDQAEELADSVWAELYGLRADQNGKRAGKLGYYSGRGSLAGWLRAIVAQLAIDSHRKTARFVQPEEDREFEQLTEQNESSANGTAPKAVNPEELLADKQLLTAVTAALRQAIGELAAEDRLVLKLYYFDDLRLREIGTTLNVHEATASRRLSKIQIDLRRRVEKSLARDYGWKPTEISENLSRAATKIDANLRQILTSDK